LIDTLDFNLTAQDAVVVLPPTGKSTEELWKEYGAEVIRWWVKDQPGTRPRCWWRYSAPEPRRAMPTGPNDPPTFELQAAYLKRLGLLLPGEEKRLQADLDAGAIKAVTKNNLRAAITGELSRAK
jgi:hypothetical protein